MSDFTGSVQFGKRSLCFGRCTSRLHQHADDDEQFAEQVREHDREVLVEDEVLVLLVVTDEEQRAVRDEEQHRADIRITCRVDGATCSTHNKQGQISDGHKEDF